MPPFGVAAHANQPLGRLEPGIPMKRRCVVCGKYLQVIGTARRNGKRSHADWKARKTHKRCWVLMMR